MANKIYTFIILASFLSCTHYSYALEDSLMKSLQISSHGNKFQAERIKVAAENIANQDSVGSTPGADPYVRKIIYPKNRYNKSLKTRVVGVKKYGADTKKPFKMKYDPYHPAADENGYVKFPNVDIMIEKADASEAQRSYEANLGMYEVSKQMINKTIEAMR